MFYVTQRHKEALNLQPKKASIDENKKHVTNEEREQREYQSNTKDVR